MRPSLFGRLSRKEVELSGPLKDVEYCANHSAENQSNDGLTTIKTPGIVASVEHIFFFIHSDLLSGRRKPNLEDVVKQKTAGLCPAVFV